MKKIIIFILLICAILVILSNIKKEDNSNLLSKELCMQTSDNKIVYQCIYKKNLFNLNEYITFLKKKETINLGKEEYNQSFLIEQILADKLCKESCLKLDNRQYEKLFQCAKINDSCNTFIIIEKNIKQICDLKEYNNNMFLNSYIYEKYMTSSELDKTNLCKIRYKIKNNNYQLLDIV